MMRENWANYAKNERHEAFDKQKKKLAITAANNRASENNRDFWANKSLLSSANRKYERIMSANREYWQAKALNPALLAALTAY